MAETNALLKRRTGNRTEGSNPSVSAKCTSQVHVTVVFYALATYIDPHPAPQSHSVALADTWSDVPDKGNTLIFS